ncbi:SLOG family protein [Clostridium sp. D33t1_170424_F3]|uniref:SLOG family protein n=1 Tax=Clostridium sp. D33t1_170424_F3 TaxID=2787099 RepID=UPI0018AC8B28
MLELRQTYTSLRLVCVLPCANQEERWTDEAKKRYFSILCRANRLICLHEQYTDRCMMERNRFLVDHTDSLLAVCNPRIRSGSTATLHYAQARGFPST